jgi:hypothetical protein
VFFFALSILSNKHLTWTWASIEIAWVLPPGTDMSPDKVSSCVSIVYSKYSNDTPYGAYTVTQVAQLLSVRVRV